MTHKLSWLLVVAAAALAGIAGGYQARRAGAVAAVTDQAVLQRLERLESGLPQVKRDIARTGAQMGALALNAVAAAGKAEAPEAVRPAPVSPAEQAAKEKAHYDHLDDLVRTGGGVQAAAHLRKNIDEAKAKGLKGGGGTLDVASLDCSDSLCRVEVRGTDVGGTSMAGMRVLSPGMGPLTMRPFERGRPLVFYLAAPGQELPPFAF